MKKKKRMPVREMIQDFGNEFYDPVLGYDIKSYEQVLEEMKARPLRSFSKYFSDSKIVMPRTPNISASERKKIKQLNEIVVAVNKLGPKDEKVFKRMVIRAWKIITGAKPVFKKYA